MTGIQVPILDNQEALNLVNGLFQVLRAYVGKRTSIPSLTELENFLSPKIRLMRNERLICRNLDDYLFQLNALQKYFEAIRFSNFLEDPIVAKNKIVLRYHLDCIRSTGEKKEFQIISILTIDQQKISDWTEVLHEKGTGEILFQDLND
jgi:hypothetical protein